MVMSVALLLYGVTSLVVTQIIFKLFCVNNSVKLQHGINLTKRSFISLLISILVMVAPSSVRITTDNTSISKGTFFKSNGNIKSRLKKRNIIFANHQIYTDWVFLWWLSSTSNLAGNIFIILKKSLESIPVFGYGMKNYKFIFLSRKWAQDEIALHNGLGSIDADSRGEGPLSNKKPIHSDPDGKLYWNTADVDKSQYHWPYSLILFPEGTNLSANTRQKSAAYAAKTDKVPFQNVLLPHITGLRTAIQLLKPSLEAVYDITIGYSGVKKEEYGELVYRLPNIFIKGKSPKLVDMHIRAFNVTDIPCDDEEEFTKWLYNVWQEKDDLMETYYKKGSFDLDPELDHSVMGKFEMSPLPFLFTSLFPAIFFSALFGVAYLLFIKR